MQLCTSLYDGHITLKQSSNKLFIVTYCLQVIRGLDYSAACAELGQCILHHLACESLLDNDGV